MVGAFGVACGVYTRLASKLGPFQSGVIGEAVVAEVVYNVACFLYGIALEGVGCLGDVGMAANVFKREPLEARAEDGAYL